MFWNDLKALKEEILVLKHGMLRVERALCDATFSGKSGSDLADIKEVIKDCLDEVFESEEEYSSINRLHDKLNSLVNDDRRREEVELATKTLDKFEDYMKNVDKLNGLLNEFKGCVSMARGALEERKNVAHEEAETDRIWVKIAEKLHKQEKKSRKPRKSVKKKRAVSEAPLSE